MTIKHLKELLKGFNDDDRIIIDLGDTMHATAENEVLYAFKHRKSSEPEYAPVVVLQTRADIDVSEELSASLNHYEEEGYAEGDALSELLEIGYTLEDFKSIERYDWAKRVADECGLV